MVINHVLANNPLRVVDVGALGGIDHRWAKFTSSYEGILFEPDPREYEILRSSSSKNLLVLNSALSNSPATIDFNLCNLPGRSSVYLPNIDFLSRFSDVSSYEVIREIRIETDTLDNQLTKNGIAEIDFIKIDTQGYELPILQGSVGYLDNVIGLELEVEFAPLYKNQPLFNEVDSFVREKGFELFDIKRYYWKRKEGIKTGNRKGQLVFGDALYFRSPEQVLLINNINQDKIVRSICIYLVYGYLDLAESLLKKANSKGLLEKNVCDTMAVFISKFDKRFFLPFFRGTGRIQNLFEKIAMIFGGGGWYSGTDKSLGNPQ
jgi:FkbM family methyltransferase